MFLWLHPGWYAEINTQEAWTKWLSFSTHHYEVHFIEWNVWILDMILLVWFKGFNKQWVNISSGNGVVPDGTKPLPELMLTNIHDALWCH